MIFAIAKNQIVLKSIVIATEEEKAATKDAIVQNVTIMSLIALMMTNLVQIKNQRKKLNKINDIF